LPVSEATVNNIKGYTKSIRYMKTQKEVIVGDKGGKKDKEKGQKQKAVKNTHEAQLKKDKQPKSASK
jgi:hypothetical protein